MTGNRMMGGSFAALLLSLIFLGQVPAAAQSGPVLADELKFETAP